MKRSEAKQAMAKAYWECWKKLEKGFEQFHRLFLFDLVDDDQDNAHQDERIRQIWTIKLSQHGQEIDMLPYSSLSPSPQQGRSCTKTSAQRIWKVKRRKRTGKTVSRDVGSGEKVIKEEAKDACARPHSGIRLSVINKVIKDSMEEDNNDKRNQTNNETANKKKEASIGGGGISVPPPNNCKGCIVSGIRGGMLIDSQSSSDAVNEDGIDNSTPSIWGLNKNNKKLLIKVEAEDVCVDRRENRHIGIDEDEDSNEDDTKILLRVQGADLRQFDKYKNRLHLTTTLYGTFARNAMHLWSWRI